MFIEQNIHSVLCQSYPHIQHIVIDGKSTDNTVEVLKKYTHLLWVSEKDGGQADALNKGLAMAEGSLIGWLNSDDFYEKDIIREVVEEFRDRAVMWVIGNKAYFYDSTGQIRADKSERITLRTLLSPVRFIRVSQQGAFFRKSFLEDVGGWKPEFYMKMDRDLWVRLVKKSEPRMVNKNWAYSRIHDSQKTCRKNNLLAAREVDLILRREGIGWFARKCAIRRIYYDFAKATIKAYLINRGLWEMQ